MLVLGATFCFSVLDSLFKHLSQYYRPHAGLGRCTVQALVILAWLAPKSDSRCCATRKLTAQLFRGAILIGSSLCFISAALAPAARRGERRSTTRPPCW